MLGHQHSNFWQSLAQEILYREFEGLPAKTCNQLQLTAIDHNQTITDCISLQLCHCMLGSTVAAEVMLSISIAGNAEMLHYPLCIGLHTHVKTGLVKCHFYLQSVCLLCISQLWRLETGNHEVIAECFVHGLCLALQVLYVGQAIHPVESGHSRQTGEHYPCNLGYVCRCTRKDYSDTTSWYVQCRKHFPHNTRLHAQ